MSKEVPLVIYCKTADGEERRVIGTASVEEDGTMTARITEASFLGDLEPMSIGFRSDDRRLGNHATYSIVDELLRKRDPMNDKNSGFSVGNRLNEPHHPDGWESKRETGQSPSDAEKAPPRGTVGYGEHDVPKKD